jgi:hypothetical protein
MPTAADTLDVERQQLTALAERMLLGDWYADLVEELNQYLAPEMLARMTHPDVTRNAIKSYSVGQNVLYTKPPTVTANGADLAPILRPELWPLRQRGNLLTIGLRDSFMRLDWYASTGLTYRVVSPSYITAAWATPERPDVPVGIQEMRLRTHEGKVVWTRDTWDVSKPGAPVFKIEVQTGPEKTWADVTGTHMPGLAPGAYPYMRGTEPIFPWVMYHGEITDCLWHWNERRELIDGTLKVGCLWTMWIHGVRDCAHPQRVATDMEAPQATTTDGIRPVDKIALDQSAILMLRSVAGRNGSVTTLAPGMDPKAMADAILAYEAGLAQSAGLNAADVQQGGTTGMSGYAIVVSRDGQRRAWAAQKPAALMGDRALLATAAKLTNAYGGTALPESPDDYTIAYADMGRTADEIKGEMDEVQTLVDAGLIGPIDAVMRVHPQLDYAGAVARLVDIAKQKMLVAAIEKMNAPAQEPLIVPPEPPPAGA